MILYDDVCTPCARKQEWRQLRQYARKNKHELIRFDVKKQPDHVKDMWWGNDSIPLPVLVYGIDGERTAVNLSEFLSLHAKENI